MLTGFVESMENSVNMSDKSYRVGVIVPPDAHYKPILYSHVKATAQFNKLNRAIYTGVKNSKSLRDKDKKTPLHVKIILTAGALFFAFSGLKKLFRR